LAKVVAERDPETEGFEVEVKSLDEVLAGNFARLSGDARKSETSIGVPGAYSAEFGRNPR
jgi:hypothetical protein